MSESSGRAAMIETGAWAAARSFRQRARSRIVLPACLFFITATGIAATERSQAGDGFDHFGTGFPLTGRHEYIDCAACHLRGQFSGTPMDCGLCHNNIRAPGKHARHVPSSDVCDNCHLEYSWTGARFDHGDITGECSSCHDNSIAAGKTPNHILSTTTCDDCHNTVTFTRVGRVDHDAVFGVCDSCHNGVIATGKFPAHPPTTAQCDICHKSTISWRAALFDHSNLSAPCSACHNGSIATGKPPGHIPTTDECGFCHTTNTWSGADSR